MTSVWTLTLQCGMVIYKRRSSPVVQVTGAVKQPLTLSADDLAKMPRASVHTTSNGMETVYQGVWLHDVLKKAGVPQGGEGRFPLVVPKDKPVARAVRMLTKLEVVQLRK